MKKGKAKGMKNKEKALKKRPQHCRKIISNLIKLKYWKEARH